MQGSIQVGDVIHGFTVTASAIKPTGMFLALRCACCGAITGRRLKTVIAGNLRCDCINSHNSLPKLPPLDVHPAKPVRQHVPADCYPHVGIDPLLRTFKRIVDRALAKLSPEIAGLYGEQQPPSIPPDKVLKALLFRKLFSIDSDHILLEQIVSNAQFRWFLTMGVEDETWELGAFLHERETLMQSDAVAKFYNAALERARKAHMLPTRQRRASQREAAPPLSAAPAPL